MAVVGCVCARSFVSPISMTAGKIALRLAKVGSARQFALRLSVQ